MDTSETHADEHPPGADLDAGWRHRLEAFAVRLVFGLFARLSLERASALGGWLGRTLGPRLPVSRQAENNLRRAFPEHSDREIKGIVCAMWDNLGRTAGEYPHLGEIDCYAADGPVEVIGAEYIDRLRDDGEPGFFFSGHLANWELLPLAAVQRGIELTHVYRRANNPLVEDIIQQARNRARGRHIGKGPSGAREMMATLHAGGHLAMLVDQKLNDGIAVPFFGREAMTAPALAQLARRFECPVVPARIERLGGVRFRLTVFAPLAVPKTDDAAADAFAAMREINALLEGWIRERPEQWTWVHRRWPD